MDSKAVRVAGKKNKTKQNMIIVDVLPLQNWKVTE